ncbi:hypothetical protein ACDY97_04710 [Rhizobium mongolense]|uniref:hypothetical protein n=1 Tax=Rhizobium mongolense TaxID=57676 RepID=UPI003557A129
MLLNCLLMRLARSIGMAKTLQSSAARIAVGNCLSIVVEEGSAAADTPLDFNALNGQCNAANRIFAFALHPEASIYVAASCDCRTRVRQD